MSDAGEPRGNRPGEATEVAPGIHRLAIPTPFPIGAVNTYLIVGEPLTLIDSGPNWATALDALEAGLGELGYRVEDLQLLIASHEHPDHVGLLHSLRGRSGAEVAAIEPLAPFLGSYEEEVKRDDAFADAAMLRHGVPADVIEAYQPSLGYGRKFGSAVEVDRRLRDGDSIHLSGGALRVLHRPGHSRFDTLFLDERGSLIAGDHLIRGLSPNAVYARPIPGAEGGQPRPVRRYMESLRTLYDLPVEIVLAGHREPFPDLRGHIDERLAFHEQRAEEIYRALAGPGTASTHELARLLFGPQAFSQAFPATSELLGHLDLLVESGAVRAVGDAESVRFEIAAEAPASLVPRST